MLDYNMGFDFFLFHSYL